MLSCPADAAKSGPLPRRMLAPLGPFGPSGKSSLGPRPNAEPTDGNAKARATAPRWAKHIARARQMLTEEFSQLQASAATCYPSPQRPHERSGTSRVRPAQI
eukprot:9037717-Pyramimonas_sp.AAC.1